MGFSKCNSLFFAAFFSAAICAMPPAFTQAQSIDYRFESNSTYRYSGGLSPNILFDLSGTFTVNRSPGMVTISNALLALTNPSEMPLNSLPPESLYLAGGLANFLENDQFVATFTPNIYFGTAAADMLSPNIDDYSITIDDSFQLLTLSGSGNPSGVPVFLDGDQFTFSATAVAIPEPAGLPACVLLAMTFIGRRRRGDTR